MKKTFRDELTNLLNCQSKENMLDFILAEYLSACIASFDEAFNERIERICEEGAQPNNKVSDGANVD